MFNVFIPQKADLLELTEDWQVVVPWYDRNLRMLAAFKLTGQVQEVGKRWVFDYSQDKYVYEEFTRNITVANKLYEDYDGEYAPALITFEAGTQFFLTRYNHSQGHLDGVDLKCAFSTRKGVKDRCLRLPIEYFNGMPCTLVDT
jgi:hypothetical protein